MELIIAIGVIFVFILLFIILVRKIFNPIFFPKKIPVKKIEDYFSGRSMSVISTKLSPSGSVPEELRTKISLIEKVFYRVYFVKIEVRENIDADESIFWAAVVKSNSRLLSDKLLFEED